MADPASLIDPFGIWRGIAQKLEEDAKEMASKSVNSDEFNGGLHRLMNVSLTSQQAHRATIQRYLEALNIPTRTDVDAIGERLQAIEARLADIATAVDRLNGGMSAAAGRLPGPPRTKQPPVDASASASKNAKSSA